MRSSGAARGLDSDGPRRLGCHRSIGVRPLVTGVLISLGTKWGLFRHWWVLISLILTVFPTLVLVSEAGVISHSAAVAADPTTSDDALRGIPTTLPHSDGGLAVLVVIQVLSVYKPRGMTRYGWRKQRAEGKARQDKSSIEQSSTLTEAHP